VPWHEKKNVIKILVKQKYVIAKRKCPKIAKRKCPVFNFIRTNVFNKRENWRKNGKKSIFSNKRG
jgi:hypothetical protein